MCCITFLLLKGGHTVYSTFKVPIEIYKFSSCSIKKNSELADLICQADLVIWDKAPMQHRHIYEAVNRTFQDIWGSDAFFGGLSVVFDSDFQQILPVIEKGSRAKIVGAYIQKSHIWPSLQILYLHQNMRLNVDIKQERAFAQ